jgi:H/ACA ribonucleoprotein complex subunit 3
MKDLLLKCTGCRRYTLSEKCPACGDIAVTAHPAKYSPDDRYARYRSHLAYDSLAQST